MPGPSYGVRLLGRRVATNSSISDPGLASESESVSSQQYMKRARLD
jgi:hypothetical protein